MKLFFRVLASILTPVFFYPLWFMPHWVPGLQDERWSPDYDWVSEKAVISKAALYIALFVFCPFVVITSVTAKPIDYDLLLWTLVIYLAGGVLFALRTAGAVFGEIYEWLDFESARSSRTPFSR